MDGYETFSDLFDDLFKKKSGLTAEDHALFQDRQRAFFEKAFFHDEPYLHDFLYNKHLSSFGSLFRKFCDIIDISQDKLSDISRLGYGTLIDKRTLSPGANIGSLAHDAISRMQLGSSRPTPQQIYFWIAMLEQCFKEINLEILPEAKDAFYLLGSGGGPPKKIDQSVNFVKGIRPGQQWKLVRAIESVEINTDCEIPSAHPEMHSEKNSDMRVDDVEQVQAHLRKLMEESQH